MRSRNPFISQWNETPHVCESYLICSRGRLEEWFRTVWIKCSQWSVWRDNHGECINRYTQETCILRRNKCFKSPNVSKSNNTETFKTLSDMKSVWLLIPAFSSLHSSWEMSVIKKLNLSRWSPLTCCLIGKNIFYRERVTHTATIKWLHDIWVLIKTVCLWCHLIRHSGPATQKNEQRHVRLEPQW